jgi:hypothetical protein
VEYCVAVESGGKVFTYPEGSHSDPNDWDFSTTQHWQMSIQENEEPILLFDAQRDRKDLLFPNFSRSLRYTVDYKNGPAGTRSALSFSAIVSGPASLGFTCQIDISKTVLPFRNGLRNYKNISIHARAIGDTSRPMIIKILAKSGEAFGSTIMLTNSWNEISVPLSAFERTVWRILPDSYPLFLEKTWENSEANPDALDIGQALSIQIAVPSGKNEKELRFELSSISLTK